MNLSNTMDVKISVTFSSGENNTRLLGNVSRIQCELLTLSDTYPKNRIIYFVDNNKKYNYEIREIFKTFRVLKL